MGQNQVEVGLLAAKRFQLSDPLLLHLAGQIAAEIEKQPGAMLHRSAR